MTEYVITIENGDYPLTFRTESVADAFLCLVTVEKWHHLDASEKFLNRDSLMESLVRMKEGKGLRVSGKGYQIERVTESNAANGEKEGE